MANQHVLREAGPVEKPMFPPEDRHGIHLKRALGRLGYPYETAPFTVTLRLPVGWEVAVQGFAAGSDWTTLPSAAAVGSPACRDVEGPVVHVGSGATEEYRLAAELYRGSIVLAGLGRVPARDVVLTARDHGALGVLFHDPRGTSVRAVAPGSRIALPAATIGRNAAKVLACVPSTARLTVESEEGDHAFENLFVRRGDGPLHVVVAGHHHARPLRLGPGSRSMSRAAMLLLLEKVQPPADRHFTFAFMDGEEFGSLGSARYYEELRSKAVAPPDLVVDLNALGTRRELGVEVHQPQGDGGAILELAVRAFEAAGLRLATRELDERLYGGTPRPRIRCPVVLLGGRPRQRVPSWDLGEEMPDGLGVSRLVDPIATILCEAKA